MPNQHEFQLNSGRLIRLTAIDQWGTYSGLLEGLPTREMNARIIKRTLEDAKQKSHFDPYLIQPTETLIEMERKYPYGVPASIPAITCVAHFDCFDIARDASSDGSTLSMVWFQSDFAFPIDEAILSHIQSVDWDKYASDYAY